MWKKWRGRHTDRQTDSRLTDWLTDIGIDPGVGEQIPKYGVKGRLMSMSPHRKKFLLVTCIRAYDVVYNAATVFSSEFDNADNRPTELRPVLSHWERVRSRRLGIRTAIFFGTPVLKVPTVYIYIQNGDAGAQVLK